jgi:phosphatidylserine/phosphatidylglycerophosphate/cardiolipin synthase-like enzyme
VQAVFARTESIAEAIEASLRETQVSLNAALYSFSSQRLFKALCDAQERGVRVRLLVDRGKYEANQATRELLARAPFDFRVARGRNGAGSKMHHKFVLLDDRMVLTGSYNWTSASEEQNYENLLIFADRTLVDQYRQEFDSLWASADAAQGLESTDASPAPAQAAPLALQ